MGYPWKSIVWRRCVSHLSKVFGLCDCVWMLHVLLCLFVPVIWSIKLLPVMCRPLIHMLCPSHSKSNPPFSTLHIFCHSNMTPPPSFILLFFLLNSLSTHIRMKDGFSWPPVIFLPLLFARPALAFYTQPHYRQTGRHARAACSPPSTTTTTTRPSPLWRVATIETGEPKWQRSAPVWGPSPGASRVSAQPILMHVFRNKLASLLKSLLWPMNIWCGQGCGVEGYNDRVLSYLARQRGSVPGPTQNTPPPLLRSGRTQSRGTLWKHFVLIRPHLWSIKSPSWNGTNHCFWMKTKIERLFFPVIDIWEKTQWAFNRFNGPRSDITHPGMLTRLTK